MPNRKQCQCQKTKKHKQLESLELYKIDRCLSKIFEKQDLLGFNKLFENPHNNKFIAQLRKKAYHSKKRQIISFGK